MIGDHIKSERGRLDMTQRELAEALGVGYRTVQRWESGDQPVPLTQQAKITALFAARSAQPLAAYTPVELLAEVIRRLDPAVAGREIELLAQVIQRLATHSEE